MSNKRQYDRQIPGKYINEFMGAKCAVDMLKWGLFPNSKEICESFGCYRAVASRILEWGLDLRNPNTTCIVVGDGSTPRTAATFAMRSKWQAISIDPALNDKKSFPVDRLTLIKKRIQDCRFKINGTVILIHCHSHAYLDDSLKAIEANRRIVVAMPCCVGQYIAGFPHSLEYRDKYIPGPHNLIKIWERV